jgi:hypothetical protein
MRRNPILTLTSPRWYFGVINPENDKQGDNMAIKLRPLTAAALCGLLTLALDSARADVTIERATTLEGVGAMALGNMSGTSKTTISGDKSRTDSDMKMQSKVIGFLARNAAGPSAEIIRLDEDKIYRLNINKKEYTETTFEQMREQLKTLSDRMSQSGEDKQKQPSAIDESKCEWLPPKVDVKKSGEKAQFAGYDAERVTITAAQPCRDKETGSVCEVALSLDEWLSTSFSENTEAQRFYKAYAAKMGMDAATSQDASQRAQAMFSQYKGIWTEIVSKMQGVKGYPVKTSFILALGGEQCQNANVKQAQSGDSGDSSSGSSPSALAGAMAGKIGSLFHKKKDDADTAPTQPAPATTSAAPLPPGDVAIMTISSQLVSVSTTNAGAETFTVPADFKKRESKTQ